MLGRYDRGVTTAVGVRGLLFSDLEGSTRLLEGLQSEAYGRLLAVYHRMVAKATAATGGEVVDREGDGLFCVFPTAGAALEAAVAAQQAMGGESWPGGVTVRARMGVHVGEVSLGEAGYVGMEIHRAARVAQAAWGGQILVSETARTLAQDLEGFSFDDLGPHRLKDLTEPLRLYVLAGPGLASGFPPPRTLEAHPHNLPVQLSSFVGRDQELEEVAKLLRGSRLLTLTGVGGSGKTRLAMQAGAAMASEFADGVWLIDLAPVSEPELVVQQFAAVLGIREQANRSLMDGLKEHLGGRELLLLIDNCEHLIDAVDRVVGGLLSGTDKIRVLATSREPLHLPGEVSYRVPPLRVPASQEFDPRVLGRFDAVRLFVARAESVRPGFRLTAKTARAVAEICRRLDGIPLAIELAAARLASFSPDQIASHLDQRFRLLSGGRRGGLPRHDTLQATIDWSYEFLDEQEQRLFRRLATFRSDFSLEAAQRILTTEGLDEMDLLEVLPRLIDKSLVLAEPTEGEMRYRLLETIREYAATAWEPTGERPGVETRHAGFFLELAEEATASLGKSAKHDEWMDRLNLEHDNLRQSLRWTLDNHQIETGLRLAGALYKFWLSNDDSSEGLLWLHRLLSGNVKVADSTKAKALLGLGTLSSIVGQSHGAIAALTEAIEVYRRLPRKDWAYYASALNNLGTTLVDLRKYRQAEPYYTEALEVSQTNGHYWGVAMTLGNLGRLAAEDRRLDEARRHFSQAEEVARDVGSLQLLATVLENKASCERDWGDPKNAIAAYAESIALYETAGPASSAKLYATGLAIANLRFGLLDQAISLFHTSASELLGEPEMIEDVIVDLAIGRAELELATGSPERGSVLLGFVDSRPEARKIVFTERTVERIRDHLSHALSTDQIAAGISRGRALGVKSVQDLILAPIANREFRGVPSNR